MSTMAENERLDGLIGNGIRLVNQRCKFESMMDDTLSVRRRIPEHDKKDILEIKLANLSTKFFVAYANGRTLPSSSPMFWPSER